MGERMDMERNEEREWMENTTGRNTTIGMDGE